jgi:predicted N-acetyltransferase YhbS
MVALTVPGLQFHQGYLGNEPARNALASLLQDIFEIDIRVLDRLGGPDLTGMPFGWFDEAGHCVANLTAFPMPLIVEGRPVHAHGLQSGAVRPEWRGRGLYRDVLGRALGWCEAQGSELVLLMTSNPDLYTKAGFRMLAQHRFVTAPPPYFGTTVPAQPVDLTLPADLALVRRLLVGRAPVSQRLAVRGHGTMFLFNAAAIPALRLSYLPSADALVAWETDGDLFRLLDIVAPAIPSMAPVLAALGQQCRHVEICFPVDQLNCDANTVPRHDDLILMARGRVPITPGKPFCLPPTADF